MRHVGQGSASGNSQLGSQVSISKWSSNWKFLFEIDSQAGKLLKSAIKTNFQPILNPTDAYKDLSKPELVLAFDFLI